MVVLGFNSSDDPDMAREVLTKWRRDPEYLWAIKQLGRIAERAAGARPRVDAA